MTKIESLEKISQIYDLIREVNEIAKELRDVDIMVQMGSCDSLDPLNQFAKIHIRIATDLNSLG